MNQHFALNQYDFSNRTVVITGGAGILGGEMACSLISCGANVVILDREPSLANRILDRLEAGPGHVKIICADVLSRESLNDAEKQIRLDLGVVDTLINAAGGNNLRATTGDNLSFFDLPEEAIRFVYDLNVIGTILSSQIFGKGMAEMGRGVILNISSMNAIRPLTRIPAYSAAKAGVSNFTQWLAVHMAKTYSPDIRVNAIAPGFFLTEGNRFFLIDEETGGLTARGEAIIDHTPMGRFGRPSDLVGTVLWLLSDGAKFITGVIIPVDGGFSAYSGV